MQATIRLDGLLLIEAESEVEGYALMQWHETHCKDIAKTGVKIAFTFDPMISRPADPEPDYKDRATK